MDKISTWLLPSSDLDINDLYPRHGPGAVADLPSGGDKYTFPSYPSIVDEVFPAAIFCGFGWKDDHVANIVESKVPAKLIAVPKDHTKPRLIASEPVVHQYLQQALMKWLRVNLHPSLKVSIDFTDQEPSRKAALAASRDGKLATVDLSAASDRLSLWVVESVFRERPFLLEALIYSRSSHISDDLSINRRVQKLRKFAPMGSAVTFPIQSCVYAMAAYAASVVWEGLDKGKLTPKRLRRIAWKTRVFGDDLIVPKDTLPYLALLFNFLELKVNLGKTHYLGQFRESCGMDAYGGYDITPAYVSHSAPTRPGDILDAYVEQSNNAHRKGLWHLAARMKDQIPSSMLDLIPTSSENLGVSSFFTTVNGTLSKRWRYNKHLHRFEVRGFTQTTRIRSRRRETVADLLQYFIEEPDPQSKWEAGHRYRTQRKVIAGWVESRSLRKRTHR